MPEAVNIGNVPNNNHSHVVLPMPPSPDCVDRCGSPNDGMPQRVPPQRAPSDMESQISLPRSYTLPRQFKYYRQGKSRKAMRTEHFVPSTNSSDGKNLVIDIRTVAVLSLILPQFLIVIDNVKIL